MKSYIPETGKITNPIQHSLLISFWNEEIKSIDRKTLQNDENYCKITIFCPFSCMQNEQLSAALSVVFCAPLSYPMELNTWQELIAELCLILKNSFLYNLSFLEPILFHNSLTS